jgi:hypothetical protein
MFQLGFYIVVEIIPITLVLFLATNIPIKGKKNINNDPDVFDPLMGGSGKLGTTVPYYTAINRSDSVRFFV